MPHVQWEGGYWIHLFFVCRPHWVGVQIRCDWVCFSTFNSLIRRSSNIYSFHGNYSDVSDVDSVYLVSFRYPIFNISKHQPRIKQTLLTYQSLKQTLLMYPIGLRHGVGPGDRSPTSVACSHALCQWCHDCKVTWWIENIWCRGFYFQFLEHQGPALWELPLDL